MDKLDYNLIGIRIKKHRLNLNITQEKLAESVNIGVQHLSKIENGKAPLSLTCLVSLANALHTTTDNLLMDNLYETKPNLLKEVENVFSDCSVSEIFVFTQTIIALKNNLRLKGLSDRELKR